MLKSMGLPMEKIMPAIDQLSDIAANLPALLELGKHQLEKFDGRLAAIEQAQVSIIAMLFENEKRIAERHDYCPSVVDETPFVQES